MLEFEQAGYLVTAIFFIAGMMRLKTPARARSGNLLSAAGMGIAVLVTVVAHPHLPWLATLVVVAIGGAVGFFVAKRVKMTAMPQMVALFNAMGGGAASLVSLGSLLHANVTGVGPSVAALFTIIVGAISFSGSLIAFFKLQEWLSGRPITYPLQKWVNGGVLVILAAVVVGLMASPHNAGLATVLILLALLEGIMVVLPIGGADMPVVISLLNAFTGLAAAATGFLLDNNVLIIAGALVGASGTILTQLMSRAMNRSITNILFGAFGKTVHSGVAGTVDDGVVTHATVEDVAMLLAYSRKVIVVPGYGLAVARAQQEVRQLLEKLSQRNVDVRFAIHPVAGRMPGHMNVLLAEANVPYDKLFEMDSINPEFKDTDVTLVIGANDVTNPAAKNQPNSPLYGMPVLNVDQSRKIIVLKRGMSPGFAGIDNPLYTNPKTSMLFGDARDSLNELVRAVEEM
ncbi:MAG: NAD(P)(+) transhydrogenase (Re/Si-specific) subunit beta [Sulfobacillus sp.]